jgi:uncharacterized protein with HEPN domain
MYRETKLYLNDILTCIERIQEYTDSISFEDFCTDNRTIDAVVRNFEIIGEAAKNIPHELPVLEQKIREILANEKF